MSSLVYPSERILILSSKTGGGHNSAASALEESFLRLSPGGVLVNIREVLEDACTVTRHFVSFYNYMLRNHQHYMRYYYWAIQKLKPYQSHFIYQMSLKYGLQLVEKVAPTKLVSVHPMTQHFFAYILKKLRLRDKVPLITVVTDPCAGFWEGWACDEVSQYFVAGEEAKNQLIAYGVDDSRIKVSGMPVHAKFQPIASQLEKQVLREQLALDPDRFTVLVNAGWAGGGNVPALSEALLQQMNRSDMQMVFLAGNNPEFQYQAEIMAQQAPFPVKVLGFADNVEQMMNASDVMISKLGGLTTFEAMACHLPILGDCITPPMPQEAGTARYIEEQGAGRMIENPYEAIEILNRLIDSPIEYGNMKDAANKISRPGAVDQITSDILSFN